MKKTFIGSLFVLLLLGPAVFSAAEKSPREAVVTSLSGTVHSIAPGGAKRALKRGGGVYGGEVVVTGAKSACSLAFADGSELNMPSGGGVQINDSRANQQGHSSVALLAGMLWAKIMGDEGQAFEVETSTSVVGVRGTEFSVGVSLDGTSRVNVIKSAVDVFHGPRKSRVSAGGGIDVDLEGNGSPIKSADRDKDWRKFQNSGAKNLRKNAREIVGKMSGGMKAAKDRTETERASVRMQLTRYRAARKEIDSRVRIIISEDDKKRAASAAAAVLSKARRAQVQSNRVRANAELIRSAARDARSNPGAYGPARDAVIRAESELNKFRPEKYQREVMDELSLIGSELEADILRLDLAPGLRRIPVRKKSERLEERAREIKLKRPGGGPEGGRDDARDEDHDLPPIIEPPPEPPPEPEPDRQGDYHPGQGP